MATIVTWEFPPPPGMTFTMMANGSVLFHFNSLHHEAAANYFRVLATETEKRAHEIKKGIEQAVKEEAARKAEERAQKRREALQAQMIQAHAQLPEPKAAPVISLVKMTTTEKEEDDLDPAIANND